MRIACEVQALRRLSHLCIVAYFDDFIVDEVLHIVLEYADGGDLAEAVGNRRLAEDLFLQVGRTPRRMNSQGLWSTACWISFLRFCGRYGIPPRAKRAPPWGALRRTHLRQSPVELAPNSRQSRVASGNRKKDGPEKYTEFRTAFGPQNAPKSLPK